jgi:hypothetical protein
MFMITNQQTRLWRVSWVHRSGYLAPHYWVEAKVEKKKGIVNEKATRRNAIKAAKLRSRLGDFPETWSCRIQDVTPEREKS